VLQLSDGLDPGEVVMVFQGTIPNQKGVLCRIGPERGSRGTV
jgi:hypothetical protein